MMKTEKELKDALEDIFFDALTDKSNPPYYTDKVDPENDGRWQYKVYELCADELIKRGYGDVSEYKNEIERLKSENEKLKIKCNDLKRLSDWQREEIKKLKAEVNKGCNNCETIKQGRVDVLRKAKRCCQESGTDYYPFFEKLIDKLIKEEAQNAEDKG